MESLLTTDERIMRATRLAYTSVQDAIGATRFAVGLETRLLLLHEHDTLGEYLIAALAALYDVRDTLEHALTSEGAKGDGA